MINPNQDTIIKICGIRDVQSASVAADEGADMLGMIFVPASRRYVTEAKAVDIRNTVNGKAKLVGVFKDAPLDYVKSVANKLSLDYVQLHGTETPEYALSLKFPVIKAFTLKDDLDLLEKYMAAYYLLDRPVQGKGEMADLPTAATLARRLPLFYAGGLTPENVGGVINQVRPAGVDVSGGIETDGRSDPGKIKSFINQVRRESLEIL